MEDEDMLDCAEELEDKEEPDDVLELDEPHAIDGFFS